MADYSTIKGFTVQTLSSDPYTSEVLAATWASGGALTTARYQGGSAGTLTAGLCIGGQVPPRSAVTEEYNGTAWTAGGALNTARYYAVSAGTQTAAVMAGGNSPATPAVSAVGEEYNGTSWSTVNSMQTASTARASAGTQTAAFGCGGRDVPDAYMDQMETYDGTTWTEKADLNTAVSNAGGAGTTTAGLSFGGLRSDPSATGNTDATEEWDGTSWAAGGTMTSSNRDRGSSGTQTAALGFGGKGPPSNTRVAVTEAYDGSTWTEVADLATARDSGTFTKAGSQTSTFYAGGTTGSAVTTTEEFTAPSTTAVAQEGQVWYNSSSQVLKGYKLTPGTGAWASGGDMNRPAPNAFDCGTLGTQTAALAMGTQTPAYPGILTEEYDGAAWSVKNTLNTGRGYSSGFGSTTAGIFAGGSPTAVAAALTESWDGTSWSEVNDNPVGTYAQARGGTQTAGIQMGGGHWPESPAFLQTESCDWDGSCWSTINPINTARVYTAGGGVQTSAFFAGGDDVPGPLSDAVETYDGTSWTTSPATLNTPRGAIMGSGSSGDNGLLYGGSTPSVTNITESFNGTAMTEVADMALNRQEGGFGPTGSNTACLAVSTANATPGAAGKTEEWTVPQPVEIKTFTAS